MELRNQNEAAQEHYERWQKNQEYLKRKEQELELWNNPLYREMKYTQGMLKCYGDNNKCINFTFYVKIRGELYNV